MFVRTMIGVGILAAHAGAQSCEPELLSTIDIWAGGGSVVSSGSVAAVGSGTEGLFEFVDLTDPRNPVILSHFLSRNSPNAMAISGNYLFAGEWCSFCGGRSPQLEVLDFSDPTAPVSVVEIPTAKQPRSADIAGDYLYMGLWDIANSIYALGVYDISDPTRPEQVAEIEVFDNPLGVAVVDGLLYVGSHGLLMIFDVEIPTDPQLIGSVKNTFARGIAIASGFAYLASSPGLQIVDVRNPTNPLLIGNVKLPSSSQDIVISGGVAYVAFEEFGVTAGVAAVDIRDPFNPIILSTTFFDGGQARELAMMGPNLLLVAAGTPGLRTLDISSCRPCPADLDGDADLDADDFFFYLDAFAAGNLTICDIDGDADCDAEDFFAYLDLFAAGC